MRHIAALIFCASAFLDGCATELQSKLNDLGFIPVALPSAGYGTAQVFDDQTTRPLVGIATFEGEEICGYPSFIGPIDRAALRDIGASIIAGRKLAGTIDVSADYKNQINAQAGASGQTSVTLSLKNVSVERLPLAAIQSNVMYQNWGCTQTLQNVLQDPKRHIGVLVEALKADGQYTVDFGAQGNLTADVKQQILNGLAASLGVHASNDGSFTMTGDGLYWGVKPLEKTAAGVKVATQGYFAFQGYFDQDKNVRENCKVQAYSTIPEAGDFQALCKNIGRQCKLACDWHGNIVPCSPTSDSDRHSRVAFCAP